jgi:hypothetical protein
MATVYFKTESGQGEIRNRLLNLPRSARTLLVLIDGTRSAEQLLEMVKASTAEDLQTLLRMKLIVEGEAGTSTTVPGVLRDRNTAPAPLTTQPAPLRTTPAPLAANSQPGALAPATTLDFKELYVVLNELVREQLGIMKAFRYTLEIEKATEVQQLIVLAERFAKDVQAAKGDTAAKMVRRALGLAVS